MDAKESEFLELTDDVDQSEEEEINLNKWIKRELKKRVCTNYLEHEQTPKGDGVCVCGYLRLGHESFKREACPKTDSNGTNDSGKENGTHPMSHSENHTDRETSNQGNDSDLSTWSQNFTCPVPTDAYGELEFAGYGRNKAKYVRLDAFTDMDTVVDDLLLKHWNMEKPNMLISIVGGIKPIEMEKGLHEAFSRGLIRTARNIGAWFITSGLYTGINKQVGQAVKDYNDISSTDSGNKPVVTIGIASWGCVNNRKELVIDDDADEVDGGKSKEYHIGDSPEFPGLQFPLDPNHSHFLLVDDGTQGKFGRESEFREKFTTKVSKLETGVVAVPTVGVVVEGGKTALYQVREMLLANIPVVIMKGTGRAADILAQAYHNKHDNNLRQYYNDDLRQAVHAAFGEEYDKKIEYIVQVCMVNSHHLYVYDAKNVKDFEGFDVSIMRALIASSKVVDNQLRMSLLWNRSDLAKTQIFTTDKNWQLGELDSAMDDALRMDRPEFVKIFLDHGVVLSNFLTRDRLTALYNQVEPSPLHSIFRRLGQPVTLRAIGSLMEFFVGDFYRSPYIMTEHVQSATKDSGKDSSMPDFDRPFLEMFVWSVLNGKHEMANIFWARGQNHLSSALVANSLCIRLSNNVDELKESLRFESSAEQWNTVAKHILRKCPPEQSEVLVTRESSDWSNASCMQIAFEANNTSFLAEPACRSVLESAWMGEIAQETAIVKLWVCMILPFMFLPMLIPLIVTYQVNDSKSRQRVRPIQACFGQILAFFRAPIIRFQYNVLFYLLFLLLFAYVLIVEELEGSVSAAEGLLVACFCCLVMEEIRQVLTMPRRTVTSQTQHYLRDKWNLFDIINITVFFVGLFLRLYKSPEYLKPCHLLWAYGFIGSSIRLLHTASVHKELGPKLVMIQFMIKDLAYFMIILLMFVMSYAVATYSLLYPRSPLSWETVLQILQRPYWNIYGELYLDDMEVSDGCTNNKTLWETGVAPRCPTKFGSLVVPITMGLYMMVVSVLLLNLLIAMFSYTFQKVQDNEETHWAYQRCSYFYTQMFIAPPLIPFIHLYWVVKFCVSKLTSVPLILQRDHLKRHLSLKEGKLCTALERDLMVDTMSKCSTSETEIDQIKQQVTEKLRDFERKITVMFEDMESKYQQLTEVTNKNFKQTNGMSQQTEEIHSMLNLLTSSTIENTGSGEFAGDDGQ